MRNRDIQAASAAICILAGLLLFNQNSSAANADIEHSLNVLHLSNDTLASPSDTTTLLQEVVVDGTRASGNTPMSFTNLTQSDIAPLSNGQDIPYLLRLTPSLIATSDAGNGVGYTGLWIRGSDPSRINVTINGIPLNDPESQQVFWVNTPDLSASSNQIQVQRGIGTSSNGAAAFGGAIKIETRGIETKPYSEISSLYGSFNTMKHRLAFSTGLNKDHFYTEGRLSYISSDGYIDRASSSLASAYFETGYISDRTVVKVIGFGGRERTYQSWYGTPVSVLEGKITDQLAYAIRNELDFDETMNLVSSGRTYNFYEYKDQVDNYAQDHAQIHLGHEFNSRWKLNLSANYTHGFGYFEEYRKTEDLSDYGLEPVVIMSDTILESDLIRRRWLRNHSYGAIGSLTFKKNKIESVLGGAWNEYRGEHYGEIIWMQYSGDLPKDHRYYQGNSIKRDYNVYWKTNYSLMKQIDLYADLQIRQVNYQTAGTDNDLRSYSIEDANTFFNPKAGFVYRPNKKHRVMASVAMASKEPNRNDYVDAPDVTAVKPESMTDLEVAYTFSADKVMAGITAYNMDYRNQLVLTGELNDVGSPLRMNVPRSYRRGLELELSGNLLKNLSFQGNTTLSQNRIEAFDQVLYDYTNGFDVLKLPQTNTPISFSPSVSGSGQIIYHLENKKKNIRGEIAWICKYVGKQYLDNTGSEEVSLDAYLVNDARASADYTCENGTEIGIGFWCNNILNHLYSSNGYTYSYIFGERVSEVFYYPQAERNYQVGIHFRF